MELRVVGHPVGRVEGPDKVSGKTVYTADVGAPDALWGKCLRSTLAHARLVRVDASRARQVPGVHAVLTGADVPDVRVGVSVRDLPVLARDKVRFIGDKIAAVAAETPEAADEALSRIEVEYEELPAVADIPAALADGAPVVHEGLAGYAGVPERPENRPNVLSLEEHAAGDAAQGFAQADVVVEHTFRTPQVHQVYLEPHAAVVADRGDRIHVWASCKAPFRLKKMLAAQLGLDEGSIHVHSVALGGDFGGKGSQMDVPVCYFLSRAAGRPVKMVMNYTEELMAGDPRHPAVMRLKLGARRDGALVALESDIHFDTGAYSGFKPSEIDGTFITNAYRIPNYVVRTYNVYTNGVPGGYMKSPGQPQTVFAIESLLDMLARKLDLDPVTLRLRNLLQDGDVLPNKRAMEKVRCRETIEAALAAAGWDGKEAGGGDTGRGMALSFRHTGGSGTVNLEVSCDADGEVTVLTAVPDIGTGTHTLLCQITAELLTLPADRIRVARGDTDTFDTDAEPGGSKITAMVGRGLMEALEELRGRMTEAAARSFGCPAAAVTLARGRFSANGAEAAFSEVARKLVEEEGALSVRKSYQPQRSPVPGFFVQVAEVRVDRETGVVNVEKVVTAHDVGAIINPVTHQGQIDGGFVQGLGYAVMEEMVKDGPRVTTLNLGDYCVPCVKDLPRLETVLVEDRTGPGPFAAKSIGENSIVPTAPAIANAVEAAVGVRIVDLPITAEKVYHALQEA